MVKNLNRSKANLFNDTVYNQSTCNAASASHTTMHGDAHHGALEKSWAFYNQFLNTNAPSVDDEASTSDDIIPVTNPNKALIVINGRTTEILTANKISCELFGYSENELIGMKLNGLLNVNGDSKDEESSGVQEILVESDRLDENGRIVLCSGKIFDAITAENTGDGEHQPSDNEANQRLIIPISMYMLKLTDEKEPKCLCVMEPVQRIVGNFTINLKVNIFLKISFLFITI